MDGTTPRARLNVSFSDLVGVISLLIKVGMSLDVNYEVNSIRLECKRGRSSYNVAEKF